MCYDTPIKPPVTSTNRWLFTLFIVFCLSFFAKAQNLSIQGTVDGAEKQKIYVQYYDGTKMVKDSTVSKFGSFTFDMKASADLRFSISLDQEYFFTFFYTDPVTLIHLKSPIDQSYVENPSHDQLDLVRHAEVVEAFWKQNQFITDRNMELHRRYPDKESRNTPQIRDSLERSDEDIVRVRKKRLDLEFLYLKNNPLSKAALDDLALLSTRAEGNSRLADFIAVHASLPDDTKNTYYGKDLLTAIERLQRIHTIDAVAPDFKASDINGNAVSISQYKDQKYVLIDFWASWCVPCREDHPELIALYNQFNSLIEFVSISLDTNLDAWKKAIKMDSVNVWAHLSAEENSLVNFRSTYDVAAIPLRILVDRDGKIIKRWQGADEKHIQELTSILKNIKTH